MINTGHNRSYSGCICFHTHLLVLAFEMASLGRTVCKHIDFVQEYNPEHHIEQQGTSQGLG